MFAYIEQDSYLHRRNPMIKLAVIAIWTIVVCMSYFPVLPVLTFLLAFFVTWQPASETFDISCGERIVHDFYAYPAGIE